MNRDEKIVCAMVLVGIVAVVLASIYMPSQFVRKSEWVDGYEIVTIDGQKFVRTFTSKNGERLTPLEKK